MNKTFAGFVKGVALSKVRAATSVALYVVRRDDSKSDVRDRIRAAFKKGEIDTVRKDTLMAYLEELGQAWHKSGRLTDDRDMRDWRDLGNGGRMRIVHRGNA